MQMRPFILLVGAEAARCMSLAASADPVAVEVPSIAAAALALLTSQPPRLAAVVVSEDPQAGPVVDFIDWTMRLWPHLPVVVACAPGSSLRWLHRPNLHRVAHGDAERLASVVAALVDERMPVAH
ncbi:MAG: hypothetical protein H0X45_13445 [Planctomycetes bacterium]|nr:hypothetical protein [Planctomycetota bacterium]